jgi:hypothetical protein
MDVKTVVLRLDGGYLTAWPGAAKDFSSFFEPIGLKSALKDSFLPSQRRFLRNLSLDNPARTA